MLYSFFFLALVSCSAYANTLNLTALRQDALNLVNSYRQAHCVPVLILNTTLNNLAQELADQAGATHDMRRPKPLPANVGESGYTGMIGATYVAKGETNTHFSLEHTSRYDLFLCFLAGDAIDLWYAQIYRYNCATGTSSSSSGDFTRMVWRSTTQFGFGVAMSPDRRYVYMVADYVGAGNVAGQFLSNVPCKCPPATTTKAPATTTKAPATTTKAPATTTKAPATTTKAPATTTKAPATTTKAPATTTKAPATTTKAPATTTNRPSG